MTASYNEAVLGTMFLTSVLGNDATLTSLAPGGIWRSIADDGVATPFVVFNHQAGSDTTNMSGYRLFDEALFVIKAVGEATKTQAVHDAFAQADALLGGTNTGPASGVVSVSSVMVGKVLSCYRETSLIQDEIVEGVKWVNIIGVYRLQVQSV
jgi:hypothetical protein